MAVAKSCCGEKRLACRGNKRDACSTQGVRSVSPGGSEHSECQDHGDNHGENMEAKDQEAEAVNLASLRGMFFFPHIIQDGADPYVGQGNENEQHREE